MFSEVDVIYGSLSFIEGCWSIQLAAWGNLEPKAKKKKQKPEAAKRGTEAQVLSQEIICPFMASLLSNGIKGKEKEPLFSCQSQSPKEIESKWNMSLARSIYVTIVSL